MFINYFFYKYDEGTENLIMKIDKRLFLCIVLFFVFCPSLVSLSEEMFIISTRDGAEIIVKDYRFTDEYVEFTTGNGLPGFIKKENFVKISNMVGVQPRGGEDVEPIEKIKQRELNIWFGSAAVLIIFYLIFLLYVLRKKKIRRADDFSSRPGRVEKRAKTQGHLAFQYQEMAGRKSNWVIEVRNAYEEKGVLFIDGICITTDKRKTFRADQVIDTVKDMSSGRQGRMVDFFTDEEKA